LAAGLSERESIVAGLVLTTYVVGLALEQQTAAASSPAATELDDTFLSEYPAQARLADQGYRNHSRSVRRGP
jgi:hypothetical protein